MDKACGLDVHKDSVFASILNEKEEKIFEERYSILTPELKKLRDDLKKHGVCRVATESTGIFTCVAYFLFLFQYFLRRQH